jgi:hypothetical protein
VFVARRFVFFDFNLKAEALILAPLGMRWPRVQGNENGGNVVSFLIYLLFSHTVIQDDPRHRRAWRKTEITCDPRLLYCLPPGIAACYPRSVNRNIFYIIGVIVVIIIVLKVLHVF